MKEIDYNYFIGNKKRPFHLSVGVVVFNDTKQVLCSHFSKARDNCDVYSLMRETIRPNTSLEENVRRGLMEEFGVEAIIIQFIGTIISHFINWEGVEIEKTTVYFLCKLEKSDQSKITHPDKFEKQLGMIEWQDINFLIQKMKEQSETLQKTDYDESIILERSLNYINKNENDI